MRVYDNGGRTIDRYAVVIGDSVFTMSANPLSPQGVNMYCGTTREIHPSGREVSLNDLPPAVREAIKRRCSDGAAQGAV